MRQITITDKYESRIWLDDHKKLILKMDCECEDFVKRRIKKFGKGYFIKYVADSPCKHLKLVYDALVSQGYKLKLPKIEGSKKLTTQIKKDVYFKCDSKCAKCGCEEGLDVHRINPGYLGGLYCVENCILLCEECHKLQHGREFI